LSAFQIENEDNPQPPQENLQQQLQETIRLLQELLRQRQPPAEKAQQQGNEKHPFLETVQTHNVHRN
jgi:hypothetical protein